jgi:hypothetical protein
MTTNPTIPEPANVVVRALLRSPLHWVMSHNTMLLSVTGRKTGRIYTVPISYSIDGLQLVCFTDAPWRNPLGHKPQAGAGFSQRRNNCVLQVRHVGPSPPIQFGVGGWVGELRHQGLDATYRYLG